MAERYRQDALYELASVEASIRSKRRTLDNTANATTARVAEATLPSLERRAEALRVEASTLPERPERVIGSGFDLSRFETGEPMPETWPNGRYDESLLGVPDFLRR